LLCGSINGRERPWASKRQPIDYKRCCTDRLNAQAYHRQSANSATKIKGGKKKKHFPPARISLVEESLESRFRCRLQKWHQTIPWQSGGKPRRRDSRTTYTLTRSAIPHIGPEYGSTRQTRLGGWLSFRTGWTRFDLAIRSFCPRFYSQVKAS
jgi:hypothetical protein